MTRHKASELENKPRERSTVRHESEFSMSMNCKKSMGWTIVLILLGLIALFAGVKWLALLIPAALLIWYGAGPALWSGRN
jgi:hypothetical protein